MEKKKPKTPKSPRGSSALHTEEKRKNFFNTLLSKNLPTSLFDRARSGQEITSAVSPRISDKPSSGKSRHRITSSGTEKVLEDGVSMGDDMKAWVESVKRHTIDDSLYRNHTRTNIARFRNILDTIAEETEPKAVEEEKPRAPVSYTYNLYSGGDKEWPEEVRVEKKVVRGELREGLPEELRPRQLVVQGGTMMWIGRRDSLFQAANLSKEEHKKKSNTPASNDSKPSSASSKSGKKKKQKSLKKTGEKERHSSPSPSEPKKPTNESGKNKSAKKSEKLADSKTKGEEKEKKQKKTSSGEKSKKSKKIS